MPERNVVRDGMAKLPEVDSMSLSKQLDELVAYKQEQLQRVDHETSAQRIELAKVKEEIRQTQQQAKYDQSVERKHFEDGLQAQMDAIQSRRHGLETLDLELNGRQKEVEILEAKATPIKEALKKLADERLAIEQQRLRNEELRQENDRLANTTSALSEEVRQSKRTLDSQQAKVNAQAIEQETLQRQLDQQQKDILLQTENLKSLKETVDPKLSEIKSLSEKAESDRHQAEVLRENLKTQQAEIDKQKSDLAILSSQLEAKSSAIQEFDLRLRQYEQELRVKVTQAKAEGIKIADVPAREGAVGKPN